MANAANIVSLLLGILGVFYGFGLIYTNSISFYNFLAAVFLYHALHYSAIGYDHARIFFYSSIALFKRKQGNLQAGNFLKEHEYIFYVSPFDTDTLLHMNNSRYAYNADFARTDMYSRCALLVYTGMKHYPMMTSSVIRYRTSLQMLDKVTIKTKVVYWDDRHFYIEQKFCANKKNDKSFVCAILLGQYIVMHTSPEKILQRLYGENNVPKVPQIQTTVEQFLSYNKSSSNNLRAEIDALQNKND